MRRAAILLPTVLLLIVASVQMVLARTTLLSPWKGGGFGMFAAVDGQPFRWIRIYVTAADRSEELSIPMSLQDQAHRVATWPREPALRALAQSVVEREHRRGRPADTVRVEVWRAEISNTLELSETLIAHTTVRAYLPPRLLVPWTGRVPPPPGPFGRDRAHEPMARRQRLPLRDRVEGAADA